MTTIDRDFPLFVMATVVVGRNAYVEEVIPGLSRLKLRYWDHEGVNLHSRDIRKAEGPFALLQNAKRRAAFVNDLTTLMRKLPYTVFITGIRKDEHQRRYGHDAFNPYELALTFTFERVLHFLERAGETDLPVIAESRGKKEDGELQTAFYRLLAEGTAYNAAQRFRRLKARLLFEAKFNNACGLQLADLCAYPCARHILKPQQSNRAYEVVAEHIYDGGSCTGWKVFP